MQLYLHMGKVLLHHLESNQAPLSLDFYPTTRKEGPVRREHTRNSNHIINTNLYTTWAKLSNFVQRSVCC